jgi:predicted DNA-binding WGR domain protein
MTIITLYRTEADRNMHRYYRLDVQPDLFGQWCCIREWGRTGQAGQTRVIPYPAPEAAFAAFDKLRLAKEKRGYSS